MSSSPTSILVISMLNIHAIRTYESDQSVVFGLEFFLYRFQRTINYRFVHYHLVVLACYVAHFDVYSIPEMVRVC